MGVRCVGMARFEGRCVRVGRTVKQMIIGKGVNDL